MPLRLNWIEAHQLFYKTSKQKEGKLRAFWSGAVEFFGVECSCAQHPQQADLLELSNALRH